MTELKTIKDITRIDKDWLNGAVNIDELKAEAVKWVKEDVEMLIPDGEHGEYQQIVKDVFIKRWMERLNITEEDLKVWK